MANPKTKTYLIRYDGDEWEEISFCAESEDEAIRLFNAWCINDENTLIPYTISSVTLITNEADAEFYGEEYQEVA